MELISSQVAVVVGGASGIGRAIAEVFAREGCRVGVIDGATETSRWRRRRAAGQTTASASWPT